MKKISTHFIMNWYIAILLLIVVIGAVGGSMERFQEQASMINNGGGARGRRPIKFVPTPFPVPTTGGVSQPFIEANLK
jgi:hypothetical protein